MPTDSPRAEELKVRWAAFEQRAQALEADGLPFPLAQVRATFDGALADGQTTVAEQVLRRGEALTDKVATNWVWVRELLRRADELRAIAGTIGVDLGILDARVGNPRKRLMTDQLSDGSLERAAASASLALAVLNDAVPKFCIQEAQKLGDSIRQARNRGEDVKEAAGAFSRLLLSIQDQNLPTSAQRLVEVRRAVARIPRAPALAPISANEEEEILLEARNLARRLQRIKGKARDAHSAARLMTQVRAALAEDRRYGTPEEEIEELWLEVDRLTRERKKASEPPVPTVRPRDERTAAEVIPQVARGESSPMVAPGAPRGARHATPKGDEEEDLPAISQGFLVPYTPPEYPYAAPPEEETPPAARPRTRARDRA